VKTLAFLSKHPLFLRAARMFGLRLAANDDDRNEWNETSPSATLRRAREFEQVGLAGLTHFRSSLREAQRHHSIVPFAIYANFGRAIELGLKAFLMRHGKSSARLRRLGHDLKRTLHVATKVGVAKHVMLTENDVKQVELLSRSYRAKLFDYAVIGYMEIPHIDQIVAITAKLLDAIEPVAVPRRQQR
jgi:hypothetical protein